MSFWWVAIQGPGSIQCAARSVFIVGVDAHWLIGSVPLTGSTWWRDSAGIEIAPYTTGRLSFHLRVVWCAA